MLEPSSVQGKVLSQLQEEKLNKTRPFRRPCAIMVAIGVATLAGAGPFAYASGGQVKATITIYAEKGGTVTGNIKSKTNPGCAFGDKVSLFQAKGSHANPKKDKRLGKAKVVGSDAGSFYRFDGIEKGISVYSTVGETKECTGAMSKIVTTR